MWRQSVAESVGEDVHALHVSSCRGHGPPVPELATECSPTVPERCTARKPSPWQLRQQMSKIDIVLGMGCAFTRGVSNAPLEVFGGDPHWFTCQHSCIQCSGAKQHCVHHRVAGQVSHKK